MLKSILCSNWLKWVFMGLGGVGGFMISRKKTKKAIVKVGASGAGVGGGYLAWWLIQKMCGGNAGMDDMLPNVYDDYTYLNDADGVQKTPRPSVAIRDEGTSPEVLTRGGEDAVNVTPSPTLRRVRASVVSSVGTSSSGAPGTPGGGVNPATGAMGRIKTSTRTKSDGMFGGAYGN